MKKRIIFFIALIGILVISLVYISRERSQHKEFASQQGQESEITTVKTRATSTSASEPEKPVEEPQLPLMQNQRDRIPISKEARKAANPYLKLQKIADKYPSSKAESMIYSYGIRAGVARLDRSTASVIANVSGFDYFEENSPGSGHAKFYTVFDTARQAIGVYTGRFVVQADGELDAKALQKSQLVISETVQSASTIYFLADAEEDPQVESLKARIGKLAGVKAYYPEVMWGRVH